MSVERLDLHIHTTASDGAWSPEAVVRGAVRGRLDVIAITDHDTVAAVGPARESASALPLRVISGIEVSSTLDGRDVHVLGYGVDLASEALLSYTRSASTARADRMREMVRRLGAQGVEIEYAEVEEAAGPDRVNIGRPHLARVLVARGLASSIADAFNGWIADGRPAFVPVGLLSPAQAVELIVEAGGLPVWAHPPADLLERVLPTLVERGLRGLEVHRPSHGRADVERLSGLCRTSGLVATGGSDWHGPDAGSTLGGFAVSTAEVSAFLAALGR